MTTETVIFPVVSQASGLSTRIQISIGPGYTPRIILPGKLGYGWRLTQPMFLLLEQDDDGSYLLSDGLFAVYGEGETEEEALQDYMISLFDYYELLAARAARNDLRIQSQFSRLKRYLTQVSE